MIRGPRGKNHRKKNCGTCSDITQAYYYLTSPPHDPIEKLEHLKKLNILHEDIDNGITKNTVFLFKDQTLLAYNAKDGWRPIDTFLRKTNRRLKHAAKRQA